MKPSKRRDNLIAHAEAARISKKLVTLCDEAPMPLPIEAMRTEALDRTRLSDWLHTMGFRSTAFRLGLPDAPTRSRGSRPTPPAPPHRLRPLRRGRRRSGTLSAWIAEATRARRVALHVQTDLDPRPWRARLLGIGLATAPGRACYIPLPTDELTEPRLPAAETLAAARPPAGRPLGPENHRQRQIRPPGPAGRQKRRRPSRRTIRC